MRKKSWPFSFSRVRMPAKIRAVAMVKTVTMTISSSIFCMERMNVASFSSIRKFLRPINTSFGLKVLRWYSDSRKTLKVGMTMKIVNRITAGATHSTKKQLRLGSLLIDYQLLIFFTSKIFSAEQTVSVHGKVSSTKGDSDRSHCHPFGYRGG